MRSNPLGRPKSSSLAAIRDRWAGTVRDIPFNGGSRSWCELLAARSEPLPSSQQAALDVHALFRELNRLEMRCRELEYAAGKYDEICSVIGVD